MPDRQTVLDALRAHALTAWAPVAIDPRLRQLRELIDATPALRDHSERMWTRHTDALAALIAAETNLPTDDLSSTALARFVLQVPAIIQSRSGPHEAVKEIFDLLEHGWRRDSPSAQPSSEH